MDEKCNHLTERNTVVTMLVLPQNVSSYYEVRKRSMVKLDTLGKAKLDRFLLSRTSQHLNTLMCIMNF